MARASNFNLNAGGSAVKDKLSARYPLVVRFLVLLLFLGFAGGSARAHEDRQNSGATLVGPGLTFAIADFDGDLLPDSASVQAEPNPSGGTDYRIQLQLSAVGRQSLRLIGPSGGLSVEARDVNGDHAVDLVVSTAWHKQPVAIFLNNGHGRFSRAELSAFPRAFIHANKNWASKSEQPRASIVAPQNSRTWTCLGPGIRPGVRSTADSISSPRRGFHLGSFLISQAGRAPPLNTLRS
jgi:hypothetical protein